MYIGLDIGGTKTELGVFSEELERLYTARIATIKESYTDFLSSIVQLVISADKACGLGKAIGVGMPGLRDKAGLTLSANIPAANARNVLDDLTAQLNRTAVMENDCRCFALSEACYGAGEGYASVYGAVLGTGAAGGFVVGGKLIPAAQGIAGEYGHQALPAHLREKYNLPIIQCGCGLTGCLENYITGPGLTALHSHLGGESLLPPAIMSIANQGDTIAGKTRDCHLDLLGYSIATLILNYDPHVIVMGGGMSLIGGIIEKLPLAIGCHLFDRFSAPPIKLAKYGDASGARGAAILARQAYHA